MCTQYNIIAELENSTVVAKYESPERTRTGYQSESDLENALIAQLQEQGYEIMLYKYVASNSLLIKKRYLYKFVGFQ